MKRTNKWKCTVSLVDKITNDIILKYGNTYEVEKNNVIKDKVKVKNLDSNKIFELEPIDVISHMTPLTIIRDENLNDLLD